MSIQPIHQAKRIKLNTEAIPVPDQPPPLTSFPSAQTSSDFPSDPLTQPIQTTMFSPSWNSPIRKDPFITEDDIALENRLNDVDFLREGLGPVVLRDKSEE